MESLDSVLVFLQSNVFVLCFKITHKDQIPGSCSLQLTKHSWCQPAPDSRSALCVLSELTFA